jgi:hypothetical protein
MNSYEYVNSNPIIYIDPYGLTFEFDGDFNLDLKSGKARGWVDVSFPKRNFNCKKCVLHIDIKLKLRLNLLRRGHKLWEYPNQEKRYDKWGKRPRTPDRERQAAFHHELDHYTTFIVFWERLTGGLTPYDHKKYSSEDTCEQARTCLEDLSKSFVGKAKKHSRSFDREPWWQGGMYPLNPFKDPFDVSPCASFK